MHFKPSIKIVRLLLHKFAHRIHKGEKIRPPPSRVITKTQMTTEGSGFWEVIFVPTLSILDPSLYIIVLIADDLQTIKIIWSGTVCKHNRFMEDL